MKNELRDSVTEDTLHTPEKQVQKQHKFQAQVAQTISQSKSDLFKTLSSRAGW